MRQVQLSAHARKTVYCALECAAGQYEKDAANIRAESLDNGGNEAHESLAAHFDKQAADARELLEYFE